MNRDGIYAAFGQRLTRARRRIGLSQADLGNLVGLSRTSITNVECGRQPVQLHTMFELARVLRTPVAELVPTEDEIRTGDNAESVSDAYLAVLRTLVDGDLLQNRSVAADDGAVTSDSTQYLETVTRLIGHQD